MVTKKKKLNDYRLKPVGSRSPANIGKRRLRRRTWRAPIPWRRRAAMPNAGADGRPQDPGLPAREEPLVGIARGTPGGCGATRAAHRS